MELLGTGQELGSLGHEVFNSTRAGVPGLFSRGSRRVGGRAGSSGVFLVDFVPHPTHAMSAAQTQICKTFSFAAELFRTYFETVIFGRFRLPVLGCEGEGRFDEMTTVTRGWWDAQELQRGGMHGQLGAEWLPPDMGRAGMR